MFVSEHHASVLMGRLSSSADGPREYNGPNACTSVLIVHLKLALLTLHCVSAANFLSRCLCPGHDILIMVHFRSDGSFCFQCKKLKKSEGSILIGILVMYCFFAGLFFVRFFHSAQFNQNSLSSLFQQRLAVSQGVRPLLYSALQSPSWSGVCYQN